MIRKSKFRSICTGVFGRPSLYFFLTPGGNVARDFRKMQLLGWVGFDVQMKFLFFEEPRMTRAQFVAELRGLLADQP